MLDLPRADLDFYRCPSCTGTQLQLLETPIPAVACAGCSASYPVVRGIPRFVPQENYADSFALQWTIHDKTQLDSHTGLNVSRTRLFDVTGWPEDLRGEVILEAGSGAGRFTEVLLSTGAEVFSFDYSTAVESNARNNGRCSRLHLFQGDILNLPLRPSTFHKVICLGVLQHTPDPARAFGSLAAAVRPGGELVIDVYRKDLLAMLQWKYVLRPVARRMDKRKLYSLISRVVPILIPAARTLRRLAGRAGARLVPIVEYSHLGLPDAVNREWAILDSFDMYSPVYDYPQTARTVDGWFRQAGFAHVVVRSGPNGLVGRGRRNGG